MLSPLEKIDDIETIEIGTHGIYLEKGYYRGVLLPQVATEHNWDRETFLKQTCIKAGLPTDSLEADETDIYIFSAEVFSDWNLEKHPHSGAFFWYHKRNERLTNLILIASNKHLLANSSQVQLQLIYLIDSSRTASGSHI